jgi:succinate dehydrogenase/fumarate reductase flavoprotein subunit
VEVAPTTHFMMGGVVIDPTCRTEIEGLFAAGEDAGGIHGANRLGGNGVADSTVFGGIAGDVMADFVAGRALPRVDVSGLAATARALAVPLGRAASIDLYTLQRELREVMWDRAGLVRDAEGLDAALHAIDRIEHDLEHVGVPGDPSINLAWHDWLNLRNQTVTARLIVHSALERRESRGAHWRRDFPETLSGPPYVVHIRRGPDGPAVERRPVAFTRAEPSAVSEPATVEIGD